MSASESPSSASFARTPSARLTRTGVSTMRPFSAVTSKYSAASTAAVTALGRVNWFLEVSLGEHVCAPCGKRHGKEKLSPYHGVCKEQALWRER